MSSHFSHKHYIFCFTDALFHEYSKLRRCGSYYRLMMGLVIVRKLAKINNEIRN